jgi:hypothetical protein
MILPEEAITSEDHNMLQWNLKLVAALAVLAGFAALVGNFTW